jgi:hypothetical protein
MLPALSGRKTKFIELSSDDVAFIEECRSGLFELSFFMVARMAHDLGLL